MKIMLVDDSQTVLSSIGSVLTRMGHEVVTFLNGEQALTNYAGCKPDLVLLDVMLPGINGFQVARALRELQEDDWRPIIFLSAADTDNNLAQGIESGGDDYLFKPVSAKVLEAKILAMQRISAMRHRLLELTGELDGANRELERLAHHDPLTGVPNRRYFDQRLNEELRRTSSVDQPLSLLLIDLDHFKVYNDYYGHMAGDDCLIKVAQVIKGCAMRQSEFSARIGGEEFAIVLPDKDEEDARKTADRLLENIRQIKIEHAKSPFRIVTASIGIATTSADESLPAAALIELADSALYGAKEMGRNCVEV